tara:strand:+ start:932 stop:1156 length:225 start_codon:yes stop_codon:yes gene_type:complete
MSQHLEHVEHVAVKAAHGGAYIGSGATIISGLTVNEWGVIVGMIFTVLTYLTFTIFKYRQDQREERRLKAETDE